MLRDDLEAVVRRDCDRFYHRAMDPIGECLTIFL
jgi:hypothetical protein